MKKNLLMAITAAFLIVGLVACGKNDRSLNDQSIEDNSEKLEEGEPVNRLRFSIEDFEVIEDPSDAPATKTGIGANGKFIWTANDTVGVYPTTGAQVYFSMVSGAAAEDDVAFDGGGWGFKTGATYYSYYPFIGDMYLDRHHIPVFFDGQKQTGTTGMNHVGKYDYLYTEGVTAVYNNNANAYEVGFHYQHLSCIIRPKVTLPAGTWTKLAITAPGSVFVVNGCHNLVSDTHTIVPILTARQIQIDLENITLSEETTFYVYIMAAPVNLQGQQITVSVRNSQGQEYECKKTPSYDYTAGKIWGLTCSSWTEAPMSLIIDDWGDGGTISGTAE